MPIRRTIEVPLRILLPSYFYPGPIWDELLETADRNVSVIINPDSGPGSKLNHDYQTLCTNLRKNSIEMFGYVSTRWGERDSILVLDDADNYQLWYGIYNIFLDEAATDVSGLEYYRELYKVIPGCVVLNHGTVPDKAYAEAGDILVIFEDTLASHKLAKFPKWLRNYGPSKFCQIVHTCPRASDMRKALGRIKQTSGWAYVTDDNGENLGDNPYDSLPGYWKDELRTVRA